MGTPGRRRALKALAARKRTNKKRRQQGKKPVPKGRKVRGSGARKKK